MQLPWVGLSKAVAVPMLCRCCADAAVVVALLFAVKALLPR
jgi:hypothetical protein